MHEWLTPDTLNEVISFVKRHTPNPFVRKVVTVPTIRISDPGPCKLIASSDLSSLFNNVIELEQEAIDNMENKGWRYVHAFIMCYQSNLTNNRKNSYDKLSRHLQAREDFASVEEWEEVALRLMFYGDAQCTPELED